jgi:serine protease AprX
VLVTAAGNAGPGAGTIQTPGIDPLILTVGASDDNGTPTSSDDVVPTWSSVGPTPDGLTKPDLVAPGRKIVSVRVPGSTLDKQSPTHVEGPTTIRFSGTSQAVAVAAGAATLLVQQRPALSPDQAKVLLVNSARPLAGPASAAQGAGLLDVTRALAAATPQVKTSHQPAARGFIRAMLPALREAAGQSDTSRWDTARWDTARWDSFRWDTFVWDTARWDSFRWDTFVWDTARWDTARWDTARWDTARWDTARWDTARWDTARWDTARWDSYRWDTARWDTARWDTVRWDTATLLD